MYVCDCVCVCLVVRHSVGGLLNPAGYSGLESYRALDLSRSLFLSLSFCFWFSHTHSHMHIGIAAETPSPFSLGVDFAVASHLNWTSQSWGRSLSLLDLGEAGYLVTCLILLLQGGETKRVERFLVELDHIECISLSSAFLLKEKCARVLLVRGASKDVKNYRGQTPFQVH